MKSKATQSLNQSNGGCFRKWLMHNKGYQNLRFGLYAIVILLLNASVSFFPVRADLTEQQTYSLAEVSKNTVAQLEEPVTIRAYLSDNLPSSYNILSSMLRDLLQEYQNNARRKMFSYSVNIIKSGDKSAKTKKLEEEAGNYGIYPVRLQGSDGNEFKAVSAYIGLVISQGDNQELLSPLEPSDNMQYQITSRLIKMSRKNSALLSLNQNLKIYYYFSPLISKLENGNYAGFPQDFKDIMEKTAEQLYGRVDSQIIDPANLLPGLPEPGELDLAKTEVSGLGDEVESVYNAIVIDNDGQYQAFSLLQLQPTLQLGPEGLTQENVIKVISPKELEGRLADIAISSLGIAQNIGYVSDRETASFDPPNPRSPTQGANLFRLKQEAQDLYNFQAVKLEEGISKDINILLLVDPMKQLSDRDLYQLDQFVMRGGRLVVAMQPYQIVQNPYGYGTQFIPNTNIEGLADSNGEDKYEYTLIDMLEHYGIKYDTRMVMDKRSFVQRGQNPQTGAYEENKLYFIPDIQAERGTGLPFISDLKRFFFMSSAPLEANGGEGTEDGAAETPIVLVKSSSEAWTEKMEEGNKDLSNLFPPQDDKLEQFNLVMATPKGATLKSFFAGKDVPQPAEESQDDEDAEVKKEPKKLSLASIQEKFLAEGQYGRILVSGSSMLFDAQLLDVPMNRSLALNVLDYMADNEPMAQLRARSGAPNYIDSNVSNGQKNFIKWFNVLGLPLAVGLLGIFMLLNWRQRQTQLRRLFQANSERS